MSENAGKRPNKVQTQLLVNLITRQRADALAVVMGEPRAEVLRRALEGGGLSGLEQEHHLRVMQFRAKAILLGEGGDYLAFAERAARDGFTLADLLEMTEYPERTGR
jgi:hypothetical protein